MEENEILEDLKKYLKRVDYYPKYKYEEHIQAIEHLINKVKSQEKQIKLMQSINLDKNYISKSKVREMKDKLLKEYKCAEEGFMKKQIPTSVVDGTIVQELGWILQEIDKLLEEGDK